MVIPRVGWRNLLCSTAQCLLCSGKRTITYCPGPGWLTGAFDPEQTYSTRLSRVAPVKPAFLIKQVESTLWTIPNTLPISSE